MPKLAVEFVPTRALEAYENNAKIHTKEQVRQICNSIEQFGFNDPIAVWGDEIVEGHGRVMAALELGIERVPVIRLDHLTDEQRRAYTHVHNQLTMNTGFDLDALVDELGNLDFEWEELGFDLDFITGGGEEDETDYRSVDVSDKFNDVLGVFIECETESEQERVYERIESEGYACRLLTL